MTDEFSNFKSAIEWPSQDGEDAPTDEFKPLGLAVANTLASAAESFSMSLITESPIETLFGARFSLHMKGICETNGWTFSVGHEPADIRLEPQFPLGRFRYDFAVHVSGRLVALIECDGAEFHSSAEQLANDALKDGAALDAKVKLLRFTGSQLHRDTDKCVSETIKAMSRAVR